MATYLVYVRFSIICFQKHESNVFSIKNQLEVAMEESRDQKELWTMLPSVHTIVDFLWKTNGLFSFFFFFLKADIHSKVWETVNDIIIIIIIITKKQWRSCFSKKLWKK
jgi:hypothetical protein